MRQLTRLCVRYAERYIPNPFPYALILTFITAGAALAWSVAGPGAVIEAWYRGIWDIQAFALRMALVLVTGVTIAEAPAVRRLLGRLAAALLRDRTRHRARRVRLRAPGVCVSARARPVGGFAMAAVTLLLAACAVAPAPGGSSRQQALQGLRQCLNLLDAGVPLPPGAACLRTPLGALDGIARADLVRALGPAQWCYGLPLASPGQEGDCGAAWNPAWDFLAHGRPYIGGGVRDLLCEAERTSRCRRVVWATAAR